MRNGQHHNQHHNKRMRGGRNNHNNNNNNRRNHNPLTRVYESNGPDVKIRGTANHVAEKYLQLARDAQSSGDLISAENYFQHAEHYLRLIATAQEQFRQANPGYQPRPEGGNEQFAQRNEENYEDGDDTQPSFGSEAPFGTREPQPYIPPNAQPFVQRDNQPYQQQPRETREGQPQEHRPQQQPRQPVGEPGNVDSLPAFITGGAPAQPQPANGGPNGHDNQADRFPLHRRRRRHRGPRGDMPQGAPQGGDESGPDNG
ncbi:MAG: hypothetical protein QOG38_2339 [Hyphomicrobiales bacterium]|nr:hypothetical protein [Hyphomicrobiales bacterium]